MTAEPATFTAQAVKRYLAQLGIVVELDFTTNRLYVTGISAEHIRAIRKGSGENDDVPNPS